MGKGAETAKGAAGGAMSGAAIGSVGGPVGAAIGGVAGGVIGGLGGYFGYDDNANDYEAQLRQLAAGYGSRTAPQAGPASVSQNSAFRSNQAGLIAQLEAMARGEGPSAATHQMREAMDRSAGAQASAAAGAGGRGVNAGAAYRNAANNTAAIQAQGARDTGLMRVNEQLGATHQLGQVVAQGRAGDENNNQFNASQQNAMSQFNVDAQLRALGINTQAELQALLAAMGKQAPNNMGTQILAGGAQATPGLLQWAQQYKQSQAPTAGSAGTAFPSHQGGGSPVTSPSQVA